MLKRISCVLIITSMAIAAQLFEDTPVASKHAESWKLEFKNKTDKDVYVVARPIWYLLGFNEHETLAGGKKVPAKIGNDEKYQGYLRLSADKLDPRAQLKILISYDNTKNAKNNPDFAYTIAANKNRKAIYVSFEKGAFGLGKPALRPQKGKKIKKDGKTIEVTQSELPLDGNVTKQDILVASKYQKGSLNNLGK